MDGSGMLVIGSNGQLGTALRAKYPAAKYADREQLDITSKPAIESFNWTGINTVINAAAYTNVDGAETSDGRKQAWAINADAVANLVAVSAQHDMTLLHISTDYVFDGTNDIHYEDEAFTPLSTYGASKAAGDIAVSLAPKFYILRTSWVIGEGNNFVRTMLSLGKKGVNPNVVSDQIGRLTFTSELVRAIDHLLRGPHPYGTYNLTNSGTPMSWADIARKVYRLAGLSSTVSDISTDEYFKNQKDAAARPLQSTLSLDKIHSTGFTSTDWTDDLKDYINKELST